MMDQANFDFYKKDNVYGTLFFQFPKVLMYGEKYKHLSSDTKLAYMVLKDRLEYSLRNNWVDENDNVYFVFTNEELKKLFDCSNTKIAKIKKELEGAHLLMQKRMGFQPKAGRHLPNRLYLAELKVNEKDVYLREKNLNSSQSLDTSRLTKNGHDLYKEPRSLDTNRYNIDTI